MQFKGFVEERISYFVNHFKKKAILLDEKGEPINSINLSFNHLSDEYLQRQQEMSKSLPQNSSLNVSEINPSLIKITDRDLDHFWSNLSQSYKLTFNIENQNITDETILKISQLYEKQKCSFSGLNFANNTSITEVGIIKLGKALRNVPNVKQISLNGLRVGTQGVNRIIELIATGNISVIDFGLIGNESLLYLSKILEKPHKIESLAFGEDVTNRWADGRECFQNVIRRCEFSRSIMSINLYPPEPIHHYAFISELSILCKKNRDLKVDERQNDFKLASLNPNHNKYYEPDNHNANAYKFSVKSYLTNVFGSLLDEALYFLQKERRNSLRQQAIFLVTKQPINKMILEDICTSDGSIIVLTKYLLAKIKEKEQAPI